MSSRIIPSFDKMTIASDFKIFLSIKNRDIYEKSIKNREIHENFRQKM